MHKTASIAVSGMLALSLALPAFALADTATTTATSTDTTATTTTTTTTSDLAAKIQAILAQIAALRQQLLSLTNQSGTASSTPTFENGCPNPTRNLGFGSRGDDVRELQLFLASTSPSTFSADNATGFFGPVTARAMKLFQIEHGIASSTDGTVGPLTRGFFGKHCGELIGVGHLEGKAKSPFDDGFMASSTEHGKGKSGDHGGGEGTTTEDN